MPNSRVPYTPPDEESRRSDAIFEEMPFDSPPPEAATNWTAGVGPHGHNYPGLFPTAHTTEAAAVSCRLIGCGSGVGGLIAGRFVGGFAAAYKDAQNKKDGKPLSLAEGVAKSRALAKSWGVFCAAYQGAKCTSRHLRGGKHDVVNDGVAGVAAGLALGLFRPEPLKLPLLVTVAAFGGGAAMFLHTFFG
eukprot:TRINITY_DN4949_c0_g1_i1.p1 TRINITY_DN4949_c0_g1~~TRINITY_DN4949_c0_g1_i1.p1  ORF type:complete len:190 (-),score=8.69 TRINITY_DN4949_c0_g1_i1:38-607(-)